MKLTLIALLAILTGNSTFADPNLTPAPTKTATKPKPNQYPDLVNPNPIIATPAKSMKPATKPKPNQYPDLVNPNPIIATPAKSMKPATKPKPNQYPDLVNPTKP